MVYFQSRFGSPDSDFFMRAILTVSITRSVAG